MSKNDIASTIGSSIPFGLVFTQTAMLFLSYGMKYDMPVWVVWFPSLFVGGLILTGIVIFFIIVVIMAIVS